MKTNMISLRDFICEQLSELKDQRKNIIIQRLAYLKYADETKGNNAFKDLYDLLFNFLFDEYGDVRDNKNLYEYIDKLIKDNNGTIPNLPNNGTIETIDKKIAALDELEPATLKKYIKEVEKEASSKQKSEDSKSDDSLTSDMSDDELKEKINSIIDTEGLSNILGLESSRKMSSEDEQKIKDKKDNIEKNTPDNRNDKEESENGENNSTEEISKKKKEEPKAKDIESENGKENSNEDSEIIKNIMI